MAIWLLCCSDATCKFSSPMDRLVLIVCLIKTIISNIFSCKIINVSILSPIADELIYL